MNPQLRDRTGQRRRRAPRAAALLWTLYFGGSEYIMEHHITQTTDPVWFRQLAQDLNDDDLAGFGNRPAKHISGAAARYRPSGP